MEDLKPTHRRTLLKAATGALLAGALPRTLLAQTAAAGEERRFDPRPG